MSRADSKRRGGTSGTSGDGVGGAVDRRVRSGGLAAGDEEVVTSAADVPPEAPSPSRQPYRSSASAPRSALETLLQYVGTVATITIIYREQPGALPHVIT